ncbi:MAG: hypothetical protein M1820_003814 [Bogoriella megaspora]|nr:MAG: hypothetical protein M1820_003814 [Bogoriella megaspora]
MEDVSNAQNSKTEKRPPGNVSNGQLPSPSMSPVLRHAVNDSDGPLPEHSGMSTLVDGNSKSTQPGGLGQENGPPGLPSVNTVLEDAEHGELGSHAKHNRKRSIGKIGSPIQGSADGEKVLKLSPARMQELLSSPQSLPLRSAAPVEEEPYELGSPSLSDSKTSSTKLREVSSPALRSPNAGSAQPSPKEISRPANVRDAPNLASIKFTPGASTPRPSVNGRASSTPHLKRRQSSSKQQALAGADEAKLHRTPPGPLRLDNDRSRHDVLASNIKPPSAPDTGVSPIPPSLPLPPMSIPTYLQLELASERPSPLYIYRSSASDTSYESSKVKFERLVNFLLLPPELERVLIFGTLSCLDAFLYAFTILPLRFIKAVGILIQWGIRNLLREVGDIGSYIRHGLGRAWRRRRSSSPQRRRQKFTPIVEPVAPSERNEDAIIPSGPNTSKPRSASSRESQPDAAQIRRFVKGHRRNRSIPSTLLPQHKADMLKGLLVVSSCSALMYFDASRMYHSIRGQAAIKLYVIYNVLEVGHNVSDVNLYTNLNEVFDRLLGALGQDVLECLFSDEVLERGPDGRSKLLRPFWMFLLALIYNCAHATALFYQAVTLNVAVNSYSNALLTLLMSNQFVEIKGTVFKKIEKDNLFQMTCADIVERFQLWLMLTIIALRNIVEVGGLSINFGAAAGTAPSPTAMPSSNATGIPLATGSVLPNSFTLIPSWFGQVLSPFVFVIGSEMLVDWVKHAYINKFNSTKPAIYGRFLDVLARDYYSNAFVDQDLMKRIGLPVLPLACLFIRASVQTYHMFLATHMPPPIPSSGTSLSVEAAEATSPATLAAIQHIDHIFRRALGRSSFGGGHADASAFDWWSIDDVIALGTMLVFFLAAFFVLLALKLILGMCLLAYARGRYKDMKKRENMAAGTQGRRVGGWGVTEVDDDKKRWIFQDDPAAAKASKERERKAKEQNAKGDMDLGKVSRYAMVAKRIW